MKHLSALPEIDDFLPGDVVRLCGPRPSLQGQWAQVESVGKTRIRVLVAATGRRVSIAPAYAWPVS